MEEVTMMFGNPTDLLSFAIDVTIAVAQIDCMILLGDKLV
jgi:hypothetical protein